MSYNFNGYDLAESAGYEAFCDQYASARQAMRRVTGVNRAEKMHLHVSRLHYAMRNKVADDFPRKDPEGAMNFVAQASRAKSTDVRDLAGYISVREVSATPGVLADRDFYAGIAAAVLSDVEVVTLPDALTVDAMYCATANDFAGANPHHVARMIDAWSQGLAAAPDIPHTA